jgi:hypothetical protein
MFCILSKYSVVPVIYVFYIFCVLVTLVRVKHCLILAQGIICLYLSVCKEQHQPHRINHLHPAINKLQVHIKKFENFGLKMHRVDHKHTWPVFIFLFQKTQVQIFLLGKRWYSIQVIKMYFIVCSNSRRVVSSQSKVWTFVEKSECE